MTELNITNQNLEILKENNSGIITIIYKKSVTDDDNIFIDSFSKYRTNFPKLENLFINVMGTNSYYHDLEKYQLNFNLLLEDDKIKNIIITNGLYSIKKENDNIIFTIPYSKVIKIYPNVNILNCIYNRGNLSTIAHFKFETLYNNLPMSLKKINLIIKSNMFARTLNIIVFDKTQKIPFGTELCLFIEGNIIINSIEYDLNQPLTIYHNSKIHNDVYKNKNLVFIQH